MRWSIVCWGPIRWLRMTELLAGKHLAIIGLGLIGGSVARGLKGKIPGLTITAIGRNTQVLKQAQHDGVINQYSTDIAQGCKGADIVLVAVPSLSVGGILEQLKPVMTEHMVITDAASVKGAIMDAVAEVFGSPPAMFVPGHPIAGSEHSGYAAALDHLYQGKKVILTPLEDTNPAAVSQVAALWEALGAEVLSMSVEHHDAVLAATSHLPHLLAYALVDTLSQQGVSEEIFRYAAGGFRDFTRIASSDPQMWHDIFMANGPATVDVLDNYIEDLYRLRKAVLEKDSAELMNTFTRAKKSRDNFLPVLNTKPESKS